MVDNIIQETGVGTSIRTVQLWLWDNVVLKHLFRTLLRSLWEFMTLTGSVIDRYTVTHVVWTFYSFT